MEITPLVEVPSKVVTTSKERPLVDLVYRPSEETLRAVNAVVAACDTTHRLELLPVDSPEKVVAAVHNAKRRGSSRIIVAGGDGTIRDAIHGLAPEFPAIDVAVLPMGTGNDLSRSLGVHGDLDLAISTALHSPGLKTDAVRLSVDDQEMFFVNVANGGFGGLIADQMDPEAKGRWGAFAYWMSTLGTIAEKPAFRIRLILDGRREMEMDVCALAVANGRFLGGGFPVARDARIDDGLLDVTLAPPLETQEFLKAGMDFAFGNESENPQVHSFQAKKIELNSLPAMPFSVDGDLVEASHVVFEVMPGVLRLVAAEKAVALDANPSFWDAELTGSHGQEAEVEDE